MEIMILSQSKEKITYRILALIGLIGLIVSLSFGSLEAAIAIIGLPFAFLLLWEMSKNPSFLLYILFALNYFILGITRYIDIPGVSVIFDVLLILLLLIIFMHSILFNNINWKYAINTLTISTLFWTAYTILEVVNPSGVLEGWVLSRGNIYYMFFYSVVTTLLIVNINQVKIIINMYALFTAIALIKVFQQKFIGFDPAEQYWLVTRGATTHIIASGIRYFSIFTDAGNFGSNMGASGIIFIFIGLGTKIKKMKIPYLILGALSIYAMFLSGTRGAVVVPLGGIALYTILKKNVSAAIIGGLTLSIIYSFFAFTYIGQSNDLIRRMRTAFRPSEDPSYIVRTENKKKLGAHLKNKPFGEGLGLSGGENIKVSNRLTTQIANDSWFVKIWVETGIVGLILYIAILVVILINCMYIIMFKIKSYELKTIFIALLSGVFGLFLSAYGNAFLGQFPTLVLVFVFLGMIINGEIIDKTVPFEQTVSNN